VNSLRHLTRRLIRRLRLLRDDERGSVAIYIVILIPALLIASGLVLDGGRQLQQRRVAIGAAEQAARAGVQLSDSELYNGLNPTLATARAQTELADEGVTGTVTTTTTTVTVTVTVHVTYLILPGSGSTVTGTATATPTAGVNQGT